MTQGRAQTLTRTTKVGDAESNSNVWWCFIPSQLIIFCQTFLLIRERSAGINHWNEQNQSSYYEVFFFVTVYFYQCHKQTERIYFQSVYENQLRISKVQHCTMPVHCRFMKFDTVTPAALCLDRYYKWRAAITPFTRVRMFGNYTCTVSIRNLCFINRVKVYFTDPGRAIGRLYEPYLGCYFPLTL